MGGHNQFLMFYYHLVKDFISRHYCGSVKVATWDSRIL